jgi:hypothetical protein
MNWIRCCSSAALACAVAATASAQNLVANGDFTTDITTSWTTETAGGTGVTGSSVWDADSGSAAIGAARLSLSEAGPDSGGTVQGLSQCLDAPGAGPWDFGGRLRVTLDTPGAGGSNQFFLAVQFFNAANCAGGSNSTLLSSGSPVGGFVDGAVVADWVQLAQTNVADPLPGGSPTLSVRIAARSQTDGAGDALSVLFDSLYFGPAGTTPVGLQSIAIE